VVVATFVLVPGAWMGGWCWQKLLPYLRIEPHQVSTPTLTGLGEREHLATPDTDLKTHIQDVVNKILYEDIWDVILVGHSYAGMVVTGVADRIPDRLAWLVYLDAMVPRNGQSFFDDWSSAGQAAVKEEAHIYGDGWRWPIPDDLDTFSSLAGMTEEDKTWFFSKAVPQPLKTLSQPLQLTNPARDKISRTYILCTAERTEFPDFVEHARTDPNWGFYELPTGHWPMISMPQELANLLLELA
jgi:pimeloyl-ACP methyl ester carboxylesterase